MLFRKLHAVANIFLSFHFSYVGNLDRRCTEQFIEDIFSKCGKVVRCKMINAVGIYLLLVNSVLFDLVPAGARTPKIILHMIR